MIGTQERKAGEGESAAASAENEAPNARPSHQRFTNEGPIPPVAQSSNAVAPGASDLAFGAHDEHYASANASIDDASHLSVTATGLNVRSSPSANGRQNIVGLLHHGDQIESVGRSGHWVRITYQGQQAFVHGAYVEAAPRPAPANAPHENHPAAAPEHKPAAHHDNKPVLEPHANAAPVHENKPEVPQPDHKAVEIAKPHIDEKPHVARQVQEPAHAPAANAHVPAANAHAPAANAHAPAANAHAPAANAHAPVENHAAHANAPVKPHDNGPLIHAEYDSIVKEFATGHLDQATAVNRFVAFVRAHNSGDMSPTGVELLTKLITGLAMQEAERLRKQMASAPKPVQDANAHDHAGNAPAASNASTAANGHPIVNSDESIASLAAGLGHPGVKKVVDDLTALSTHAAATKKTNEGEYKNGADRQALVHEIANVRKELAALDGAGLDPTRLARFKGAVANKLEQIAPYYYQGLNIITIESRSGMAAYYSTCNMTSLGMSLELLGKTTEDYDPGKRKFIEKAAEAFEHDITSGKDELHGGDRSAQYTASGKGIGWEKIKGMRMPDFLELAAIAELMHAPTVEAAKAVQGAATAGKTSTSILDKLSKRFSVTCTNADINWNLGEKEAASKHKRGKQSLSSTLNEYGLKHRGNRKGGAERLIDLHNAAERSGSEKDEKAYEKYHEDRQDALHAEGIDEKLPLDKYRDSVIATLGPLVESGAAIMVGFWMHWTRLYKLDESGVVVQDPSAPNRHERHLTWEEARAVGCFWHNLKFS